MLKACRCESILGHWPNPVLCTYARQPAWAPANYIQHVAETHFLVLHEQVRPELVAIQHLQPLPLPNVCCRLNSRHRLKSKRKASPDQVVIVVGIAPTIPTQRTHFRLVIGPRSTPRSGVASVLRAHGHTRQPTSWATQQQG